MNLCSNEKFFCKGSQWKILFGSNWKIWDPGRFPFNKNSGLKFWKLHMLNGTVHSGCTDPTQATACFVIVASQHTHNYALKEKSKYCLYPKEHLTVEKGWWKTIRRRNPISCRKPMNGSEENDTHPEIYRSRLQIGPDLLSCSIKRNRVRVNIRVRLKKIGPDYPETGKHPI